MKSAKSKQSLPIGKKSTHINSCANCLLVIGFLSLFILSYLIYQRYNPQNLSFDLPPATYSVNQDISSLQPIGIKIDSINLSLSIIPSEINDNKWEASTKGISYLRTSVIPGDKGNSILYGHNWPNLLGSLKRVKPGQEIVVIYNDNSRRSFEVEYLMSVSPSETSILEKSEDNRITLYTCDGFLDSKRLVAVAKLKA